MTIDQERFRSAQWVLERQLGWIATADVKVGVLVAIQTAMIGGLAAAYTGAAQRSEWALLGTVGAFVCVVAAFVCAAFALFPRTDGPKNSLIFFGQVSKLERADYVERFHGTADNEWLDDLAGQIHRNAEIADGKHRWVKRAMIWSFWSAPPWAIAIFSLVPQQVAK